MCKRKFLKIAHFLGASGSESPKKRAKDGPPAERKRKKAKVNQTFQQFYLFMFIDLINFFFISMPHFYVNIKYLIRKSNKSFMLFAQVFCLDISTISFGKDFLSNIFYIYESYL